MQIFVGTSGWYYSWNEGGNFEWFVENSGLNAIELNASFYRFPFPSNIKSWSEKGKSLRWAIKVNKLITHVFKFSERAKETWKKFERLFKPLDDVIDFYLFQTPPNFLDKNKERVKEFFEFTGLKERFAFEPRHISWFKRENFRWAENLGLTWVSMDSPDFPKEVITTNGIVYLRMHGRTDWYSHYYYDDELMEVAEKILEITPEKVYVFFNNNHAMLENAKRMMEILIKKIG